jgi:hypothetical protein
MTYDCYVSHSNPGAQIEAASAEDAKRQYLQILRDCIDTENIEAINLDTEDGEDPT